MSAHSQIRTLSKANTGAVVERHSSVEVVYFRQQEAVINNRLVPAAWGDARLAIMPLFDMKMKDDANEVGTMAGLRASCYGEPLWAIEQTVFGFTTGRLGRFCPDGADFGIELRKLTDPLREKGARIERERRRAQELDAEGEASGPMAPEIRARIDAFLDKSASVSAEMTASLKREPEPKAAAPGHMARVLAATAAKRAEREGSPS